MAAVNIAEAKARLSELVDQSLAGETVTLMRRGTPLVTLVPIEPPKKRVDLEWLRAATADMPVETESGADFIRRLRDEGY